MKTSRKQPEGRKPTSQTPKERLIEGNKRIIAPSGRTTWEKK